MIWPLKSTGSLAAENAELKRQLASAKERIRGLLLEQFQLTSEVSRLREYLVNDGHPEIAHPAGAAGEPAPADAPAPAAEQFIQDFYKAA